MNKLLGSLVLVLMLSTLANAQATYFKALQNNTTTPAIYDTLYIQELDKNYELLNITIENTGAVPCTLAVEGGSFYRNAASWRSDEYQYPVIDTVYYSVPIRDYNWDISTSIIVANATAQTFLVLKQYLDLIKVYITQNAGGKVKILIEPTKPQR